MLSSWFAARGFKLSWVRSYKNQLFFLNSSWYDDRVFHIKILWVISHVNQIVNSNHVNVLLGTIMECMDIDS